MHTKVDIEIVTGFIGSGKTYFVNTLIKNTYVFMEKVLIIQGEQGLTQIEDNIINSKNFTLELHPPGQDLTSDYIKSMIEKHNPHRIIIEFNGTKNLTAFLDSISEELNQFCKVSSIFYISDVKTHEMFISNMPGLILPYVYHSNLIVLNNCLDIPKEKLKKIKSDIDKLNRNAFIADIDKLDSLEKELQYMAILDSGLLKAARISLRIFIDKLFSDKRQQHIRD